MVGNKREYFRKYYKRNREKILEQRREKSKLYFREYHQRPEVKKRRNIRLTHRRKTDSDYKIRRLLRYRVWKVLKKYSQTGKIMRSKKYGIEFQAIIEHLKPFPKEIFKYHVDHIRPLCSFDFNDPEQIKEAFAPENHQWLTIQENLIKGGKYK